MGKQHRYSEEERKVEIDRMQLCIRFAADVWAEVGARLEKDGMLAFHSSDFDPILKTHSILLAKPRKQALLKWLSEVIVSERAHTSCGLWDFAHGCHHIIYDEDLPEHL
jgi:hypothetical protein